MKKLWKILMTSVFLFSLTKNVFSKDPFILDKYILDSYTIKFGEETITFEERISPPGHLEVANPNIKDYHIIVEEPGKTIRYMDLYKGDLKLDQIKITRNGKSERYDRNYGLQDAFIVDEAQKKFDFYLELIKQAKVKDVLGN